MPQSACKCLCESSLRWQLRTCECHAVGRLLRRAYRNLRGRSLDAARLWPHLRAQLPLSDPESHSA